MASDKAPIVPLASASFLMRPNRAGFLLKRRFTCVVECLDLVWRRVDGDGDGDGCRPTVQVEQRWNIVAIDWESDILLV